MDWKDERLLEAAYGSRLGDLNWDPVYDLNGDGVVDYKDLGLFGTCMEKEKEKKTDGLWLWLGAILIGLYLMLR